MLDTENHDPQKEHGHEEGHSEMDIHLESCQGQPLRFSVTTFVLIQLVIGAVSFGSSVAMLRSQLQQQGEKIEDLSRDRYKSTGFEIQLLERMARIEERIESVREDLRRGRR
jgi:hypothetical protein